MPGQDSWNSLAGTGQPVKDSHEKTNGSGQDILDWTSGNRQLGPDSRDSSDRTSRTYRYSGQDSLDMAVFGNIIFAKSPDFHENVYRNEHFR